MLNRENVHAIINNVAGKLNTYLVNHPYYILTEAQLQAGYTFGYYNNKGEYMEKTYPYQHYHKCADGNYMAFKSDIVDRNSLLTIERMVNIYNIREQLNRHLESLPDAKQEDLKSKIDNIREILMKGKMENTRLSTKYYKIHNSYQDGRLLSQNMFLSRWNATWTKSRANRAFENSLNALNNFERKFKVKESAPKYPF